MPRYVVLINWTDQGVRHVTETLERSEQVRQLARQMGGDLQTLYWTQGRYDLIATIDAPDDETMAAITLRTGSGGGVRTEVLRAFDADEMGRVLAKLD